MYFAPPMDYDGVMRRVPCGWEITVGQIRAYFARTDQADFTDPITAGIFVSIAAWASWQRSENETPYWRTLKADGELNAKYPGGTEAQKLKLEAEGHTVIARGRTNIRYFVKDFEKALLIRKTHDSGQAKNERAFRRPPPRTKIPHLDAWLYLRYDKVMEKERFLYSESCA